MVCKTLRFDDRAFLRVHLSKLPNPSNFFTVAVFECVPPHRVHLFQLTWYMKTYPKQRCLWRSLPFGFNTHISRKNRRATLSIERRIIQLGAMMNDLQGIWDQRWDDDRTLPGLFPRECRTMLDTFPTRVRLPKRFPLARLLVNPKYGGAVVKVPHSLNAQCLRTVNHPVHC